MIDEPMWFGPPGRRLFGWFCAPDDRRARSAMLLCSPIGEEEHNAHETFRRLAARLADHGIASLRFDYHGVGDSEGHWTDPDRRAAWLTSVSDAHAALRAGGAERIGAIGMRIGATLAALASQQGRIELDALVLWDPCSGRSMLREGQARSPSTMPPPPGAIDTPGYLYPSETVQALRGMDIAKMPEGSLAPRVLVLLRDDRPEPRGLRSRLVGQEVEWAEAHGQSELLDLPMTDNTVPTATLETVVDWVAVQSAGAPRTPVAVDGRPHLVLETDGRVALAENVVRLGRAGLFGITTEVPAGGEGPTVVLINVANDRHVGPGRRWVECARSWAAMGYRVVRMDQSGAGDSPCHDGQPFGELYAREWLEDLPDALASPPCEGRDVAVVSLCSGAYSAMEAAFQVPIAAVYAINVILHATVTSKSSHLHDPRRVAARPPIAPLRRLHKRHPRAAGLLWRIYRQFTPWNSPMASVAALVQRGTSVVLLMSIDDGRHFAESVYWSGLRRRRLRESGRYRLMVDRQVDHTLMTQEGQRWVTAAITADLCERFPTARPPVRGPVSETIIYQ